MRLTLCLILTLSLGAGTATASASEDATGSTAAGSAQQASPVAAAEPASEVEAVIEEVDLALEMAQDGEYGRVKRRDMQKIESAHAVVTRNLEGVQRLDQLAAAARAEVDAARSDIAEVLQLNDPDRKICRRVAATGTRLGQMECMTLAQRQLRAKMARNNTADLQRGFCVPGEGNACAR